MILAQHSWWAVSYLAHDLAQHTVSHFVGIDADHSIMYRIMSGCINLEGQFAL